MQMYSLRSLRIWLLAFILTYLPSAPSAMSTVNLSVSGKFEAALVQADELLSYQNGGTGILRWDDSGLKLQQGFVELDAQLNTAWATKVMINAYQDGQRKLGFTQGYMQYKPLSRSNIKHQLKAGFFYPEISVENTDAGWLSPYFFTQSAINSWIGEELRILGGEYHLSSSGRSRRSPWSWSLMAGVYKGNDTTGTLLTWRGFAMHDRQSLHNDRINFQFNPIISDPQRINAPLWTEPFREIDTRWGGYIGAHIKHLRRSELKYYYYNNNADPTVKAKDRIYAWDTQFHSVSLQHELSPSISLLAQAMKGSTLMGSNIVYAEFDAYYVAACYKRELHQVSIRYDQFRVAEDDRYPDDPNDSDGKGLTFNYRYQISTTVELGAEMHFNESTVANRIFTDLDPRQNQSQTTLMIAYQF